jgi:ABC-2 type transport system ATP-binding protein
LLILDEPANGLDPGGIREMRDLMRALTDNGMTVILSSHILGEVEQICDSVTIISRGRRVTSGSVADVLASNSTAQIRVRTEHPTQLPTAQGYLVQAGATVKAEADHLLVSGPLKPAEITRVLAVRDVYVSELAPVTADLETVFLHLTETAPVAGQNRQVDESVAVAPEVSA